MKKQSTGLRFLKVLSLILFIFALLELSSYLMGKYLERSYVIFYEPRTDGEKFDEYYDEYLDMRHEVLGLPLEGWRAEERDESGSRIVPSFPDTGKYEPCVSLYGDSFTWASGVGHDEAWGNVLSEMIGCRVSNFGQPSYGTDQSYMRFKLNSGGPSEIVILAHLSADILRNVAQSFDFIAPPPMSGLRYKPRFVLEGGELKPVPIPYFSPDDVKRAITYPEKYLPYEYFAPGGKAGTSRLKFPYSLSMLKVLIYNPQVRAILERRPYAADFYAEGHDSHALQITTKIIESFNELALERGKAPVIVIFPGLDDVEYYGRTGRWVYQPLIDNLGKSGIEALNIGEEFYKTDRARNVAGLYIRKGPDKGHFNADGNKAVADIIYRYLKEKGLTKDLSRPAR